MFLKFRDEHCFVGCGVGCKNWDFLPQRRYRLYKIFLFANIIYIGDGINRTERCIDYYHPFQNCYDEL